MKKIVLLFIFAFFFSVFGEEDAEPVINSEDEIIAAEVAETDSTALKDSLFSLLEIQTIRATERSFDNAILFSPNIVRRQHFFGDDLFNWTDVLRRNPNFVSIYYSPDYPMNRALFRGHLIPMDYGLLNRLHSPTLPIYHYDLLEIQEFEILPDGRIKPTLFTGQTITPEVFFAWQGGLFRGNMLNFRVMRNLSQNLAMTVFFSHSNLQRMQFYHGGGIANMYRTWHRSDTTRISTYGHNPLSHYNRSGFAFNYDKNIRVNARYSYADIRQDLAFHTNDTLSSDTIFKLAYNESRNFLHQIEATIEIPFGERFLWRNLGKIESSAQREIPISRTVGGRLATEGSTGNKTLQSAGMQFLFAPVPHDTISIQYAVNRFISETSGITDTVSHHTRIIAENKFTTPNFDRITLTANGGINILKANSSDNDVFPTYLATAVFSLGNFSTQLYSRLEVAPMTNNRRKYGDSRNFFILQSPENYVLHGINLHYQFPIASIHGGFSTMQGYGSSRSFWHNEETPYRSNPVNVLSTGFSLGQIGPISMFSNWFFNDTEGPHTNSFSGVRFHFNREGMARHFYTDITHNFWGDRYLGIIAFDRGAPVYLGDNPHWGRRIHDISIKLAAEIETFRVFWKIDNFLNRTSSFVPGYVMPGLIFRWGFSWNILG